MVDARHPVFYRTDIAPQRHPVTLDFGLMGEGTAKTLSIRLDNRNALPLVLQSVSVY